MTVPEGEPEPAPMLGPDEGLPAPALAAFQAIPLALLIVNADGRIVFANDALNQLFEYRSGELVGVAVEALVPEEVRAGHPELRDAFAQVPYRRSMGTGRDLHGVTRSGRRVSVEIGLSAIEINGAQHIIASVLDVTALRNEQEKTRLAIDASASAMVMVDSGGGIVLANSQAASMFGYGSGEMLGLSIEDLIPERYRRRHTVYRESYASNATQRAMGGDRALHGVRADGSEFPVEIGLTPINDHGHVFIMATVIDISQRIAAEDEIRQQNADLRRLNQELGQFAYSASHDLKAPLATLDGVLMCLQDQLDDGDLDAVRASAERAQALTQRQARLIEGILGFARSESRTAEIEPVDLAELVDGLRSDLEVLYADTGVELRNEIEPGSAIVTDRHRLHQMLENLLVNGAKFADPDRSGRYVAVNATTEGATTVIAVEDNGIGIPCDVHDEVFAMFRRFHNHVRDGTGLGLAMVKQQVDHLNGDIAFASSPGGTTFTIRLPDVPTSPPATTGATAR